MSSEIMARLSLDEARFEKGLTQAERGWESFRQSLKSKPIEIIPAKSARDSAKVFEDIERARESHVGGLNANRMESALASGAGGLARSAKSAAESASIFADSFAKIDEVAAQRAKHFGGLDRDRIERALGQGPGAIGLLSGKSAAASASVFEQAAEPAATGFAASFKKIFSRKFSFGDALKDSLKSFGVAGVGAVVTSVADFFSRAAARAQGQQGVASAGASGLQSTLGTLTGMQRQLELSQREFRDLGREIEITQRALNDLTQGFGAESMDLLNPFWKSQVDTLNSDLDELRKKQDAVGQSNTLLTRELAHQSQLYDLELQSIREQNALQAQGASQEALAFAAQEAIQRKLDAARNGKRPVEEIKAITLELERQKGITAQIADEENYRLDQQAEELEAARKMNALEAAQASALTKARREMLELKIQRDMAIHALRPVEEINAVTIALEKQRGVVANLVRDLKARRAEIVQDLSSQTAGFGRTFPNGAPRPRNEAERLADRALRERRAAGRAVIEGRPKDARDALRAAERDENSVAGKLAKGSALIDKDKNAGDLTGLKTELVNANTLLKSIDASLKPVAVGK